MIKDQRMKTSTAIAIPQKHSASKRQWLAFLGMTLCVAASFQFISATAQAQTQTYNHAGVYAFIARGKQLHLSQCI
jgi:hypothetical protein